MLQRGQLALGISKTCESLEESGESVEETPYQYAEIPKQKHPKQYAETPYQKHPQQKHPSYTGLAILGMRNCYGSGVG